MKRSIHIGLNEVDPHAYGGWNGQLSGCINDANAMKAIAEKQGYGASTLIDSEATAANVIKAIGEAARSLQSGDYLLLTYSGHGGQVPDVNGDETDALDETWVLWDRMLIDDELYQLWSQFRSGTRILVLSDSCHSGTVTRAALADALARARASGAAAHVPRFRVMPEAVAASAYQRSREVYDTAQWIAGPSEQAAVSAAVILISGCQDNQLSQDGATNGKFTEKLLQVWNDGGFTQSHRVLHREIVRLMPNDQTPNYFTAGAADEAFEDERPFASAPDPAPADPFITGPKRASRSGPPPELHVHAGKNPYYIVEITSRPELFDITRHGTERDPSNFYATWNDPSSPARLTGATFRVPAAAWDRLRRAERLYYRIGTTSSATGWNDYAVSSRDTEGASAPSITIV